ncbi:MAG: SpoIIE family protein phosphatase [Salinivirgaceae bacterium]
MKKGEKENLSNDKGLISWQIILFSSNQQANTQFKLAFSEFSDNNIGIHQVVSEEKLINLVRNNHNTLLNLDISNLEPDNQLALISKINKKTCRSFCHTILWVKRNALTFIMDNKIELEVNDIRFIEDLTQLYVKSVFNTIYTNYLNNFKLAAKDKDNHNLFQKIEHLSDFNKKLLKAVIESSNIKTKLTQQRLAIEQQNKEIEERNLELERAFKKSSINHIKLQKAFHENEQQRKKLEELLSELQETNQKLETQFHEIMAQRDFIEQQNEEIQSQRDMALKQRDKIVAQQEEINDNIQYASKIQQALFPQKDWVNVLLPQHFVLNRPKDVVSGDFYWISQNRHKTIIAVSDCTGHGISGAMMSMLGTAFLNEIVNKNDITHSQLILEQLRERVISSLHQDISQDMEYSRDGMDIAVCILDIVDNSLEYAGANNPIYIVRNKELIELKADKIPIGIHEFCNEPFTSHRIDVFQGDNIYMFSDGYADQFGGTKGKKLKYNNFKKILLEINELPIEERERILNKKFVDWMGNQEQIDDVLVMGFTIV